MTRTIIAGAREGATYLDVYRAMLKASEAGIIPSLVLCGACRVEQIAFAHAYGETVPVDDLSADMLGDRWAAQHHLPLDPYFADWTVGRRAGPERNARMAAAGEALVLVWTGRSKGSASMLREAQRRELKIVEHIIKETPCT